MKPALLLLLAAAAPAADLGGHQAPSAEAPSAADDKGAILKEMWQRRILAPDQSDWAPEDWSLLKRMREEQQDAIELLDARAGGAKPWMSRRGVPSVLTKAGFDKYVAITTQDALAWFQTKGVSAKWALKLRDMEDRPLFDKRGLITAAGAKVHLRARLNLEVFWKSPSGEIAGTRRPPTAR